MNLGIYWISTHPSQIILDIPRLKSFLRLPFAYSMALSYVLFTKLLLLFLALSPIVPQIAPVNGILCICCSVPFAMYVINFCIPAITNYHKLSVWKLHKSIISQFCRSAAWIEHGTTRFRVSQAEIKVLGGMHSFLETLGVNHFLRLIQVVGQNEFPVVVGLRFPFPCWLVSRGRVFALSGCSHCFSHLPRAPFQQWQLDSPSSFKPTSSSLPFLTVEPSAFKGYCDEIGSTLIS